MRILVTGPSGYVGTVLVLLLRERGHEVAGPGKRCYRVDCNRIAHVKKRVDDGLLDEDLRWRESVGN